MKSYKKYSVTFFIWLAILIASFLVPLSFHAHELIPQALQEYIEAHPNATPEEIKRFADMQSPEFAEKYA